MSRYISILASSARGWIFALQSLLKGAEQEPVAAVLLVLPRVELALDLEAAVDQEGRAQHGELVAGHVELAGLRRTGNGDEIHN